jgi:hypothetical protein
VKRTTSSLGKSFSGKTSFQGFSGLEFPINKIGREFIHPGRLSGQEVRRTHPLVEHPEGMLNRLFSDSYHRRGLRFYVSVDTYWLIG